MITEILSPFTEPQKPLLESVQKLNQLAAANVERLTELQIESLKRYSELGVTQLKAAGEVHDLESFQGLMGKQSSFLKAFGECVLADTKALVQMGVAWLSKAKAV